MNERLLILQNDRDRLVERVDALESNATARSLTAEPTRAAPARAPLKVVKLIPSPEGEQDAADGQAEPRSENLAPDSVAQRQAAGGTGGEALQAPTAGPKSDTEATVVLYGEGAASGVRKRVAGEQP